jgi:ATPase subunit of ABC transporter with duplicated ATPase domains
MITHNAEFANAICTETWLVENGRLNVSGESWTKDEKLKDKEIAEEFLDAAGNVIKIKQKVKIPKADMKKRIKLRLKKAAANQELSDVEDWMEECCKVRPFAGQQRLRIKLRQAPEFRAIVKQASVEKIRA